MTYTPTVLLLGQQTYVVPATSLHLSTQEGLQVQEEPAVSPHGDLRADFSSTLQNTRYYYDIQVVALNKGSIREEAQETLREATEEKRRKYKALGSFFIPIILSSGGLIERSTAQAYKSLQKAIGPVASAFLDTSIRVTLARTRAIAASLIAPLGA